MQFLSDAGLRRSEAAALTWGDMEIAADGSGRVRIARSKTDQEGEGEIVAITPSTVQALLAKIMERREAMWLEQESRPGRTIWHNHYVEHRLIRALGNVTLFHRPSQVVALVYVSLDDDGDLCTIARAVSMESVEDAQEWCDNVWASPDNLHVRLQLSQLVQLQQMAEAIESLAMRL